VKNNLLKMKSMKNVTVLLGVVLILASCGMMNKGEPVKQIVTIQTNAQCGDCKDRIEEELNFTSGIVYAELDLETKKVEVKYNSKRITAEAIRKRIASLGYNADDVKADETAQTELPECCQPGGHD
jgi:copper chaperone CopZ